MLRNYWIYLCQGAILLVVSEIPQEVRPVHLIFVSLPLFCFNATLCYQPFPLHQNPLLNNS